MWMIENKILMKKNFPAKICFGEALFPPLVLTGKNVFKIFFYFSHMNLQNFIQQDSFHFKKKR